MRRIDCYLTPISPWLYLAGERPERIAARHGCVLHYKPVDGGALFARTGGLPLAQRHESRQAYRLQELRRWSAHLGMPLNLRRRRRVVGTFTRWCARWAAPAGPRSATFRTTG